MKQNKNMLFYRDYSMRTEEEEEAFLMADTLLEQFNQKFPQWGSQIERLEQGIVVHEIAPWEVETDEVMRFAWILTKCQLIAEMMGGILMAAKGPLAEQVSIVMDLPAFVLVDGLDENLLRYLGRYALDFSATPQGKGVRVQIGLPYPEGICAALNL